MRVNIRFCGFTVLLLLVMTSSNIVADDESDNWYAEGGNSVLMEQFTATWCDVCAQIDPWISNFADERGSRLVRIALHDPVADPLGSSISSERLSIHSNSMDLAPSFWFDSNNEIKGTVDPVDLDRALLNSEGVRESDTIISISGAENFDSNSMDLRVNLFNVDNSSNSQVSIFLLADIIIDKSQATNGITTHEDVAVGYLNMEIDTNFSTDDITSETNFNSRFTNFSMTRNVNSFQINLDFPLGNEDIEDISIVVAHEKIVDGQRSTLGAVSLDLDNSQNSNGINVVFPLIVICIISTVILFKDRFL
ncbi:MAG: hypothetical protein DBX07_00875 [Candidatus Poseidoniales archaeon]|nr:hypothetical protein [Euryarchaeota archaeon]OUX46909.1 MAG: hypothetical protein CBE40_01245 [Euryarchaeota archaeon TMED280]RCH76350.1 MAG: hypothetical protein DBX07_00875 [Candidatus Poseidoniales archaeon]